MIHGRQTELAELRRLVHAVRNGSGGALVLRGDAGFGKSTLLDTVAAEADGLTVLRTAAIEAEQDLPYAALHLLLGGFDDFTALPDAQAGALRVALGHADGEVPDRFLAGLAVLNLLASAGPLVCLVDDAHWLDRTSAEALLFAARRLGAEPVLMVFAARDGFDAGGLPELAVPGLDRATSATLLAERAPGLGAAARERIVAESEGNPLALLELNTADTRMPAFGPLPVGERVLAEYRSRIARLPERTRLVLTVAAAGSGDLGCVVLAGEVLGFGLDDLDDAVRSGLVRIVGDGVVFRHPLARSAVYQEASLSMRVAAHRALAESTQDRHARVRHRAAAALAPDETIAAELAAVAADSWDRGAFASSATAFEQAAALSTEPDSRADRLTRAASASSRAGQPARAAELATRAASSTTDPANLVSLAGVLAMAEYEQGTQANGTQMLLDTAPLAPPDRRAAMLAIAASQAWFIGDLPPVRRAADLMAELAVPNSARALAALADGAYAEAFPTLAEVVAAARATRHEIPELRLHAINVALLTVDDEAALDLAATEVALARADGVIGALPSVLFMLAQAQVRSGLHREAVESATEAMEIARSTGMGHRVALVSSVLGRIAAIEGDEERCLELIATASRVATGSSASLHGLLDLGLGRYEAAVRRFEEAEAGPYRYTSAVMVGVPDRVEAAVRAGLPHAEPLARFTAWAEASGRPWARAVALRCKGIASDQEEPFARAVEIGGGRPFERARTELAYGEWLRRHRRRTDARPLLRSALAVFERLKAAPWADRARAELRATGEAAVPARGPDVLDSLTPQELQIVRLAAAGVSNRDIAAQLFLSARTVEYHLYKAYPKLGVGSRHELPSVVAASGLAASA
ncbi:helix-turn-helix domain-containing protein [Solihabitans fulvus]|uniref:Helix-turn-helix domain-containing protein n=1 Tax=Solihabitans fulvus TaxID=1892852 RepID=A0A5B2WIK3_9PSEU|nr:helix-turn-helix transcriptional regulator [Solihabitans fulvus]KAA2250179.1 helix-turn-helix domain-containing protein [Solihabitans fulvus]